MSNLYRLESDQHICINLESDVEFLKEQQVRLQRLSAMVMRDIEVITERIVNDKDRINS